jgi:hypothetical protein
MKQEGQKLDLFGDTLQQKFDKWRHTPIGGEVTNRFIRLAIGLKRRGWSHHSARAIVERIRWHYAMKNGPNKDDHFKINDHHTPYLARFAMERAPELAGGEDIKPFFTLKELGQRKRRKAVVIPIQEAAGESK